MSPASPAICCAVLAACVTTSAGKTHAADSGGSGASRGRAHSAKVGNYLGDAPNGIAIIIDDQSAFVIDPGWGDDLGDSRYRRNDPAFVPPGTTAPDFSFVRTSFRLRGVNVDLTWGRVGESAVLARWTSNLPVRLPIRLTAGWPSFHNLYLAAPAGLTAWGVTAQGKYIPYVLRCDPPPVDSDADQTGTARLILAIEPAKPVRMVAGMEPLPEIAKVDAMLAQAENAYTARRVAAEGAWGDFLGPIADVLNFNRLYGSDNHRIAHTCGRGWWLSRPNPDLFPYFEWDSFFHATMASLEDRQSARETLRAVLSFVTPAGFVPSWSHWNVEEDFVTLDRSMPPVGAMCVYKMYERWPDRALLAEVYEHLVRWHDWWPKARDGNRNGLLEWGSEKAFWQGAQWESGWDDNLHYENTEMVGTSMDADAVDLSSLWAADAEYLSKIAARLGKHQDADRFRGEHARMNRLINERLWNQDLGIYCSRRFAIPPEMGPALEASSVFPDGFEAVLFADPDLDREVLRRHDAALDFDWGDRSAAPGLPTDGWSGRWTGTLRVDQAGQYRLATRADDGVRVWFDSRLVIDDWKRHEEEKRHVDLALAAGTGYPIRIEYFDHKDQAVLQLSLHAIGPGKPSSDFLTRITPMNFYPLISGAPDPERAARVLEWVFRKDKFWGDWPLPTVAYDDPAWPQQHYWRGHVWPPANYLVWQGILRYADPVRQADFARRSVELFMRNWREKRQACENYRSSDGACGQHPHYSWSGLLNLIGLEALVEVGPDLKPVPRQPCAIRDSITLRRVPLGGSLYRIERKEGKTIIEVEK